MDFLAQISFWALMAYIHLILLLGLHNSYLHIFLVLRIKQVPIRLGKYCVTKRIRAILLFITPTRIRLNSRQQPSTIDFVLSNGIHTVSGISTRTAFSSDHLPVFFEVEVIVQREVPDFFDFDYRHANWDLFCRTLDENLSLNISLDRMGSKLDLDVMVETFTSVMVEARSCSVPMV
jgi:hypothetical protein